MQIYATLAAPQDLILQQVKVGGTVRLSEVLEAASESGCSRAEIKQALVELLNDGHLTLTADRRLEARS